MARSPLLVTWSMLAKANIWLRTAERVLIVLDSFRVRKHLRSSFRGF